MSSAPKETAPRVPTRAAFTFYPRFARFARYRPTKTPLAPDDILIKPLPTIINKSWERSVLCIGEYLLTRLYTKYLNFERLQQNGGHI